MYITNGRVTLKHVDTLVVFFFAVDNLNISEQTNDSALTIYTELRVRLSPFPRVESRFNTHNQNAFASAFRNAFLELLRLSSISQNRDYEYIQCVPEKRTPETKECCDQVPAWPGCMTVVIPPS